MSGIGSKFSSSQGLPAVSTGKATPASGPAKPEVTSSRSMDNKSSETEPARRLSSFKPSLPKDTKTASASLEGNLESRSSTAPTQGDEAIGPDRKNFESFGVQQDFAGKNSASKIADTLIEQGANPRWRECLFSIAAGRAPQGKIQPSHVFDACTSDSQTQAAVDAMLKAASMGLASYPPNDLPGQRAHAQRVTCSLWDHVSAAILHAGQEASDLTISVLKTVAEAPRLHPSAVGDALNALHEMLRSSGSGFYFDGALDTFVVACAEKAGADLNDGPAALKTARTLVEAFGASHGKSLETVLSIGKFKGEAGHAVQRELLDMITAAQRAVPTARAGS